MPPKKVIQKKTIKVKDVTPASTPEAQEESAVVSAVADEAVADEAVVAVVTETDEESHDNILTQLDEEILGLENMRKELTTRIQAFRKIRKATQGMVKKLNKKKNSKKNSNKTPSGINAKHPIGDISEALATFMKSYTKTPDLDSVSRIDALKAINGYVKEHNLQKKDKATEIAMDPTLKKLFPTLVSTKTPLKYTGIMGPLGQHFPKKKTA